jgi:hypothetical protein
MDIKILEIRDEATCIPVLCVNMNDPANEAQRYYLRRLGFPLDGRPNVAMTHLDLSGAPIWNDPYGWRGNARTYATAHNYIYEHWHELQDGDVVDVQHILGETTEKKISERLTEPL